MPWIRELCEEVPQASRYLESQVAPKNRPLYPRVDHNLLKVALNSQPLAFPVVPLGPWRGTGVHNRGQQFLNPTSRTPFSYNLSPALDDPQHEDCWPQYSIQRDKMRGSSTGPRTRKQDPCESKRPSTAHCTEKQPRQNQPKAHPPNKP